MHADLCFVTGASGNVGQETLKELQKLGVKLRTGHRPGRDLPDHGVLFDFCDPSTYAMALQDVSSIFLMRPPQISNIQRDMLPFLRAVSKSRVTRVVFLSLQGAENRSYLPHRKIELALEELGIPSTFLRPSFFMENLSTTHLREIREYSCISVPAGTAVFNFVSCKDIGKAAAYCLTDQDPQSDTYRAYTLTGAENLNYSQVADILSRARNREIRYYSPGPIRHYFLKRQEGSPAGFAAIMTLLYYSRRFGTDPHISSDLLDITGEPPVRLETFAHENRELW